MSQLRLARTCSTCKFAQWGKSNSPYWSGGKKQTGICFVHCEGNPPKSPSLQNVMSDKGPGSFYIPQSLDLQRLLREKKEILSEESFVKEIIGRSRDIPISSLRRFSMEEFKNGVIQYYRDSVAYDKWWRDNYPSARINHRITVCDLWEEGGDSSESWAKSIVNGKRKLRKL